jgi:hypothetical protein
MVRLAIHIPNITQVMEVYDQIKVKRATSQVGAYSEITGPGTRIALVAAQNTYFYDDVGGSTSFWYKTSYFNSTTLEDSADSLPMQGGTEDEKIGYSFNNYGSPPGEWGRIVTADDIRYTYLWGIDLVANDQQKSTFGDEQLNYFINSALSDFERHLNIDIRKRIYKTSPADTLKKALRWTNGIDYTDEEEPYPFEPGLWEDFGFIQLRHKPLISVERGIMYSVTKQEFLDLLTQKWIRIMKKEGHIYAYPTTGYPYGPFSVSASLYLRMGVPYPQGFEFDYTTGYPTSDYVDAGLREIIAKWAACKTLSAVGDGMYVGVASSSISLDSLSESVSLTQSASSTLFGARVKQYTQEIDAWLKHNKAKYAGIPISFVGS